MKMAPRLQTETERIPPAWFRVLYTRGAFIFSSLFVFDLRIGLSLHLLLGTEAYPLLTNAEESSQSPNV